MRRHPDRVVRFAAPAALAVATVVSGCSSGTGGQQATSSPSTPTTSTSEATHEAAPGAVEVSPNGVTTAIGAPAESTEDEYSQACLAARAWFDKQGGDPHAQVEQYLATLQSASDPGPGTFHTQWSQLPPGRQAAVLVAVHAAADQLCG